MTVCDRCGGIGGAHKSWCPVTPVGQPRERRWRACVEAWPDAEDGAYNPACCRFPKSCSPYPYDEQLANGTANDDTLEPGRPSAPVAGTADDTAGLREEIWSAVAEVRDRSPRLPDDADSYDVADAVLALPPVRSLLAAQAAHAALVKGISALAEELEREGWISPARLRAVLDDATGGGSDE